LLDLSTFDLNADDEAALRQLIKTGGTFELVHDDVASGYAMGRPEDVGRFFEGCDVDVSWGGCSAYGPGTVRFRAGIQLPDMVDGYGAPAFTAQNLAELQQRGKTIQDAIDLLAMAEKPAVKVPKHHYEAHYG
jgi:hypothetical protein